MPTNTPLPILGSPQTAFTPPQQEPLAPLPELSPYIQPYQQNEISLSQQRVSAEQNESGLGDFGTTLGQTFTNVLPGSAINLAATGAGYVYGTALNLGSEVWTGMSVEENAVELERQAETEINPAVALDKRRRAGKMRELDDLASFKQLRDASQELTFGRGSAITGDYGFGGDETMPFTREEYAGELSDPSGTGAWLGGLAGSVAMSAVMVAVPPLAPAMLTAFGAMGFVSAKQSYLDNMAEMGLTPDQEVADLVGLAGGLVEVVSEKIGLDVLPASVRKKVLFEIAEGALRGESRQAAKSAARAIALAVPGAGVEAIEEMVASLGQNIAVLIGESVSGGPELTVEQITERLTYGMGEAALGGLIAGGALSGPMAGVTVAQAESSIYRRAAKTKIERNNAGEFGGLADVDDDLIADASQGSHLFQFTVGGKEITRKEAAAEAKRRGITLSVADLATRQTLEAAAADEKKAPMVRAVQNRLAALAQVGMSPDQLSLSRSDVRRATGEQDIGEYGSSAARRRVAGDVFGRYSEEGQPLTDALEVSAPVGQRDGAGTPMGVGSADDAVLENVNEARGWKLKSVGREDIGERELAVERDAAKRGLRVVWFAGDSGSTRAGGMYNDEGTVYLRHSGKTQFDESAMRDAYLGIITHEAAHDDEMTESGAADIAALREAAIPGYATMTRESKARWLASRGYDEELVTARRAPGESDEQFNQRQADMDAAIDSEVGAVLQEDASSLRSSGALSLLQSDRGRLGKALDYVRRGLTRMGMGSDETRAVLKHLQRVTSRPAASVSEPYTGSTQEPKFSVSRRGLTNQTSLLTKAIHDTKERVMTAARFQRFLQTSSIKTEEIYWSGLEDYMKGKESINLDEVEAMLQPVDLKEITLGGGGEADAKRQEDANNAYRLYLKNLYVIKQKDGNGSENRWFFVLDGSRSPSDTQMWSSKDEAQQGLDLWIETRVASDPIRNLANYGSEPDIDLEYGPSTNPGMILDGKFSGYNEILVSFNKEGSTPPRTHWTEPGVVAHARITGRETNRGRVLFVEEIQSDWHQKGRKQGYVGDAPPATSLPPLRYKGVTTIPKDVARAKEMMVEATEWEWEVVNDINGDFVEAYPRANVFTGSNPAYYFSYERAEAEADGYLITDEGDFPGIEKSDSILSALKSKHENDPILHTYDREGSLENFYTNVRVNIDSHFNNSQRILANVADSQPRLTPIANAPFKGSSAWAALMLKRVVILAAEKSDITAVVIIDGESTGLRYDRMIADKVTAIKVTFGDRDGFVMDLTTVDGEVIEDVEVEDYAQLVDNIGNKMADEAVARLNAGETSVEFTGDNMTVGGQGFKKFYDDIVRKEAEKIAKHLGVTMTTVPVGAAMENGEQKSFVAIPMTDAAREVIATVGLKLFSASSSGLSGQTSLLANVIANAKERVMTAPRFQRFLQTSSIKAEEIYWSGLKEYMKGKESINLDEVEAMLTPVVLEEKFLENKMTEPEADESEAAREAELVERRENRAALEATMIIRSEVFDTRTLYVLEGHPIGEDTDGPRTELGVYDSPEEALAGMESYLDDETTPDLGDWLDRVGYSLKDNTKFGPRTHPRYTLPGPHRNYKETLITFGGSSSQPPDTHWDEVGVVAHARSTERDTILGPVIFGEELQSDWHQQGRDKGYRDDVPIAAAAQAPPIVVTYKGLRDPSSIEVSEAKLAMRRLQENVRWEWVTKYREDDTLLEAYPQAIVYGVTQDRRNEYFFAYGREEARHDGLWITNEDELARLGEDEVLLELQTRFLNNPPVHWYEVREGEGAIYVYTNVITQINRYYNEDTLGTRSERVRQQNLVANAPFKGSSAWSALLIKRLVVMAAQTPGITHVVIIDGATTAKRTNQMIADKVSAIKVRLSGTDGYWLDFTTADGAGRPSYYVEKLNLAATIGNKMAEESVTRLAAGETSVEFTGDNMTVGGKGFETFYDVIARKEMEKIAKYLNVTMTTVPVGQPEENGEPRSYMAIPMTDAAREKVNGPGFSLFSASKSKLSRRDFNQTIVAKFSETYSQGGDIGRETGFLLDDGTPVQMGVGYRASDHREIVGSEKELRSLGVSAKSIKEKNEGTRIHALQELLTLGSMIRTTIDSGYVGLELGRGITATPEQRSAIRRFVDEISPSQVVIDRTSADGTVKSETLEDPSGEEVSLSLRFSASGTPLRVLAKHRAQLLSLRFPELGPSSFLEMTARNGVTVEPRLLAHKETKAYHIDGLETSYAIREEADGSMRVFGMNSGSNNVPFVFEAAVFHAITRNPSSTVTIEGSTTSESDHRLMLRLQSLGVQVTVDTKGIFHGTISDLLDTRTRTGLAERGMAGWAVDSPRVRGTGAVGAGSVQPLSDNVDGNRSGLAVPNAAKGRSASSDSRGGNSRGTISDSARRIADRLVGSAERLANLTAEQLAAKLDRSRDLIPVGSTEHELIATYFAARVKHSGAVRKLRGAKIPGVSQTRKQGEVATALTELLAAGNALRAVQQPRFERYGSEWMPPSASGAVSKSVPIGTIFPGVVEASVQRVASMLNRHAINILGVVDRSAASTINISTLAMAAELEHGVSRGGKAVDWYEQTLKTVLVLWESAFPVELVTSKDALKNRGVLFAIFAITSNGQTVDLNTSTTLRAFEIYLATGVIAFPKGYSAARSAAMNKSFALLNKMLNAYGSAKTFELLAIRGTSRAVMMAHVKQIRKDIGGTVNDVKFDAAIPDGLPMQLSQMFGPKIGAFYANLNGNFDILTADLWFTRTFLYYSGFLTAPENQILRSRFVELQEISKLINGNKPVKTNRLALVKKGVPRDQADIKAAAIALGFKTSMMENPAQFAAWVQNTASAFVNATYKEGGLPIATSKRGPRGAILTISTLPAPVQAAVRVILHGLKTIYEGDPTINEAPANATERAAMATAVRRAMVMQAKGGTSLEVSAAQAVLWYFEKDVYYTFNAGEQGEGQDFAVLSQKHLAPRLIANGARHLLSAGRRTGAARTRSAVQSGRPNDVTHNAARAAEFMSDDAGEKIIALAQDYRDGKLSFNSFEGSISAAWEPTGTDRDARMRSEQNLRSVLTPAFDVARLRADGIQYSASKRTLRGEYWFTNDGMVQDASDEQNHEVLSMQQAAWDFKSWIVDSEFPGWKSVDAAYGDDVRTDLSLQDEAFDDLFRPYGGLKTQAQRKKFVAALAAKNPTSSTDQIALAMQTLFESHSHDARLYATSLGWIRVHGNNIEVRSVTNSSIRTMADGIYEVWGETANDQLFTIDALDQRRTFDDVPFAAIASNNVIELIPYRGVQYSASRFPRLYHGSKNKFEKFGVQKSAFGYFFTDNKDVAAKYGDNLKQVELNATNPADLRDIQQFLRTAPAEFAAWIDDEFEGDVGQFVDWIEGGDLYTRNVGRAQNSLMQELKGHGYDVVIFSDVAPSDVDGSEPTEGSSDSYVVFDESKIEYVESGLTARDTQYSAGTLSAGRSPLSFQVGLLNTIRTRGQDSFILLEKAIESFESAHGALQPALNPLLAIRRMPGAVADKQKTFRTETVNPILNRMKLAGIGMAQMGEYLFALHAPERNRYILQINPGSKGVGSGMTDDQSLVIVESVEKMSNVAEWKLIAREWQAIARDSLDTQLAAGLIKQSDHDNIVARYPNYVPMPDAPEGSGSRVEREVARFSLNKKQLKSSVGRGADAATEESFEAIIPELVGQRETVMSRAFRNIVANRFMRLAKYKNEPGLWSIVKPKKIRVMNVASGTVEEVEDDTWREDPQIMQVLAINPFSYSITEQVDGKDVTTDYEVEAGDLVLVYINNWELGTNLTRGSTQSDHWAMTIVRVARFWSGWVRMFATSAFNPDFLLSNPTRDVQTAAATIATEHKDAKSILKAFAMGYPSAWKAVYNAMNGRKVGKHAKHWDDFEKLGGRQQLFISQDFETRYKELQAQLDDPTRWERNQDRAKYALIGFWDNLNHVMDNATRFAFYVALVEAGVHPEIAAVKARNLTVDFTKRGSETGVVMGMYAFANASIQGTTKFVGMSRTRRGKQVIGSLFAFGFINAMLQDLLSDDDEDKNGVKDALQIEEYKHQTNAIIPTGMDFAIKIPLSYGLNIPYVLGRNLYRAMSGKVSAAGAAGDSAKAMMATFNPFGGEGVTDSGHGFIRSLMPDILDIPTDLAFNKDYRGNPISHVSPWEKDPVMSETGSKKVPQPVKSFAQLLNSVSGGDYATSGVLDFPPDSIWYVFQQLVGGTGKSFERIGISVANLIDGQVEISTIPGLRRFAEGYPSDESNTSLYYTMRDEVFTHDENAKRYESSAEQSKARRADPFLEKLVDNFKLAEKELKELKKELRAAEAAGNEALVEIKLEKIAKQRTKAVKAYSDAKNRQK